MIKIILVSIIEGITELLPISSTGHMIIVSHFLNVKQDTWFKGFELFIQFGAILPLIIIFKKDLLNIEILKKMIIATIPCLIVGYLFKDFFLSLFNPFVVSLTSIIGGILFILIKNEKCGLSVDQLTYLDSFKIGIFQILSFFPGFSRSGAAILGGYFSGLSLKEAAKFSFIIGIPLLFVVNIYELLKNKIIYISPLYIVGFIISFVVSYIITKWFLEYLNKYDLKIFGYYRIILGIIILVTFYVI